MGRLTTRPHPDPKTLQTPVKMSYFCDVKKKKKSLTMINIFKEFVLLHCVVCVLCRIHLITKNPSEGEVKISNKN